MKLKGRNIFQIIRIAAKINLKELASKLDMESLGQFMKENDKSNPENEGKKPDMQQTLKIGVDFISAVVPVLAPVENEIYELFADLKGVTVKDIADMESEELFDLAKEVFKLEGFIKAFKSAT